MLGSLKKLFSRKGAEPEAPPAQPQPFAAPPTRSSGPAATGVAGPPNGKVSATTSRSAPANTAAPAGGGPNVFLSLNSVLESLPEELTKLRAAGNGSGSTIARVVLPLHRILPQLAQGSVKISFGELRKGAPAGTFLDNPACDTTLVRLPLKEVLKRVPRKKFQRRPDQATIEAPPDISDLFGTKGERLVPEVSQSPQADATQTALPLDAQGPALKMPLGALSESWPLPIQSEIQAGQLQSASVQVPVAVIEAALRKGKLTFSWELIRRWTEPAPAQNHSPHLSTLLDLPLKVVVPLFVAAKNLQRKEPSLPVDQSIPNVFNGRDQRITALPAETAAAPAAAASPPETAPAASIPLAPAPTPASADKAAAEIPAASPPVESTPQTGVKDTTPSITETEEPAPTSRLSLPNQETPAADPIPFTLPPPAGIPFPNPPAPAAAEAPAPPAAPSVAPLKTESEPATMSATSMGGIFGQPDKADWTLKEIVQNTVKLPGVSGALVAMQDGLLAAAEMPDHLKAETIAAFLPQVFGRLGQYASQLQMGALSRAALHCDGADWVIFQSGPVYFLAAGRRGNPLPLGQLETIAAELGEQENT